MYKIIKTAFLLWLILPQFNGALLIHDLAFNPAYNLVDDMVLSNLPPM